VTPFLILAAMLALVLMFNSIENPGRVCPLCNGHGEHHKTCPQRDRDE
jgi:hypothetical protein